ncbi:MAG: hypothetical protein PW790_07970 [Parvibaculaceae bacterium]|nr:hypothetical protein [Parvibaculaceae bacterium]
MSVPMLSAARPDHKNHTPITIATYESVPAAADIIRQLGRNDFPVDRLAIRYEDREAARDVTLHPVAICGPGHRAARWGSFGALIGGVGGLTGAASVVFALNPFTMALASNLFGLLAAAFAGAALVGSLTAIASLVWDGWSHRDSSLVFESDMKGARFDLVVDGSAAEADRARRFAELRRDSARQA